MPSAQFSAEAFSKRMTEIVEKVGNRVEQVAEDATKDLFREVIEETPVGRPETWSRPAPPGYIPGKARANWMPSTGAPDTTVTESRESSVSRLGLLDGNVAGNLVYLTNSVPYIYRLEKEFWSNQQPNGWVERTVRSFENKLTKAIRNLSS
mgnify:CR=1 FL=1